MAKPRVPSSQIADVIKHGLDLVVTFNDGKRYGYTGAAEHERPLLDSRSPGSYLHSEIKKPMVKNDDGNMALKYPAVKL